MAPHVRPGSATDLRMPHPRSRIAVLLCSVVLSGLVMTRADMLAAPSEPQFAFQQYEVVSGSANRQTVLTGFLLGSAVAELAIVEIDGNQDRRVHIYAFNGDTWAPSLDAPLRPDVLFVDVAGIGGRDRLLTYAPGRLSWFDPESSTERALADVASNFNPPRKDEIPHVDLSRDVNGDGRDDLAVPDVDGFWVFIQMSDGAFADPVKIGLPTEMGRIYGPDGYRYDPWSQSRIHEMDYDQDGRRDLAFWQEDHFEVHTQDERGLFGRVARTFTTDVAFDSDQLSWLASGDMVGKVLHSLTDLNGDGVADLVVFSLQGRRGSSKQSAYEVHFGAPTSDGGTVFAPEVGGAIQSDGQIQLGMDQHDFDRDGQADLMVTTIEVGYLESSLWRNLKGFMGDSIHLQLEFYRMQGGLYPDEPNATREIKLRFPATHREPGWMPLDQALRGATDEGLPTKERQLGAFNAPVLVGDVTGDGRSDLLVGRDRGDLRVSVGVPGPDLFAREPQVLAIDIPYDEEYIWLVDLNEDGKQDLLMHHPSTSRNASPGTEPHRVIVLLAR